MFWDKLQFIKDIARFKANAIFRLQNIATSIGTILYVSAYFSLFEDSEKPINRLYDAVSANTIRFIAMLRVFRPTRTYIMIIANSIKVAAPFAIVMALAINGHVLSLMTLAESDDYDTYFTIAFMLGGFAEFEDE